MMAAAALVGIDPMRFMTTESDIEAALLRRVAIKAIELQGQARQDLANRIISALAQSLKKGRR